MDPSLRSGFQKKAIQKKPVKAGLQPKLLPWALAELIADY